MDNKSVKNNIYLLRKDSRLSQKEVAERIGISRNAYRDIEKGDTVLVSDRIEELAKAFNTTSMEVLGYSQEKASLSVGDDPSAIASENIRLKKENRMLEGENERLEGELKKANDKIASLEPLVKYLTESLDDKKSIITMLKKRLDETEESE